VPEVRRRLPEDGSLTGREPSRRRQSLLEEGIMTAPTRDYEQAKHDHAMKRQQQGHMMKMGWGRFAAMIATSIPVMFILMYQLVYESDHLMFSLNRLLAAFVMAAVMAVIMLGFMWSMYKDNSLKIAVLIGAALLGIILLSVNRSQSLVNDTRFMKAMIPHHSIAINNAEKADIRDPRVRKLADEIIASQVREIREMKLLLDDIARNGPRGNTALPARPAVVTPDMEQKIREALE
jgi:uncharacterized protein (DUF305 family)